MSLVPSCHYSMVRSTVTLLVTYVQHLAPSTRLTNFFHARTASNIFFCHIYRFLELLVFMIGRHSHAPRTSIPCPHNSCRSEHIPRTLCGFYCCTQHYMCFVKAILLSLVLFTATALTSRTDCPEGYRRLPARGHCGELVCHNFTRKI